MMTLDGAYRFDEWIIKDSRNKNLGRCFNAKMLKRQAIKRVVATLT